MKKRIFLSYSPKDAAFVAALQTELSKNGFETWSDSFMKPGEKWEDAITKALKAADIFMPILSQTYMKSDYRIAEIGSAYGLDKYIMPIHISGNLAKMPFRFSDYRMLDARKSDLKTLIKTIQEEGVRAAS